MAPSGGEHYGGDSVGRLILALWTTLIIAVFLADLFTGGAWRAVALAMVWALGTGGFLLFSKNRNESQPAPGLDEQAVITESGGAVPGIAGGESHISGPGQFEGILEAMDDGVCIIDKEFSIEYINPALKREFGKGLGLKCYDLFEGRDSKCPWCKGGEVFDGKSTRWEWTSEQTGKTYDIFDAPVAKGTDGLSRLHIFHDVTGRKRAQDSVENQERLFRSLSEARNVLLSMDIVGEAAQRTLGIVGSALRADRVFVFENRTGADGTTASARLTFEWTKNGGADGKEINGLCEIDYAKLENIRRTLSFDESFGGWVEKLPEPERAEFIASGAQTVLIVPIFVRIGFWGFIGVEDRAGERKWSASEESFLWALADNLRVLIERDLDKSELVDKTLYLDNILRSSTNMAIAATDLNFRILYYNPTAEKIFGYTAGEVIGKTVLEVHTKEKVEPERFERAIKIVRETGEYNYVVEDQKEGKDRVVESRVSGIKNETGELVGFVLMSVDATGRRKADEELVRTQISLKEAQRIAHVGNWDWDITEDNLTWSDEIYRIFNVDPEKFENTFESFLSFVHPHDREFVRSCVNKALEEGAAYSIDHRIVLPGGDERVVHEQGEVFFAEDGAAVRMVGTVQDITERKQREEERAHLATAIEQAAEAVIVTSTAGEINYVNPAFEMITGYPRDEVVGKNPKFLASGKHESYFYASMWGTLLKKRVWRGSIVNRKKDGSLYEAETTISPVLDSSGAITSYISVQRDVTKEVRLEKRILHGEKMEAIGTLAGGIAHDFNNILSSIIGFTELAADDAADNPAAQESLSEVLQAAFRAKDLVRQILTFSRRGEKELKTINLALILKETLKLVRASLPATIQIEQEIDTDAGYVMADATQIQQVIMNLCANADHSMKGTMGKLEVKLKTVEDGAGADQRKETGGSKRLKLSISDTGHGMDKEVMERMFEPFFTTKKVGEGTGLGLAAVHGIITRHGGAITVSSEPDQGATFNIYFPAVESGGEHKPSVKEPLHHGSETVLFIDDEAAIRKMGQGTLEKLGYDVITAANGEEGLDVFRKMTKKIDIVVTDQTMPGLSGESLATELHKIRPGLPIILCTGYSQGVTAEQAAAAGISELAIKPVLSRDLSAMIRRALSGPATPGG